MNSDASKHNLGENEFLLDALEGDKERLNLEFHLLNHSRNSSAPNNFYPPHLPKEHKNNRHKTEGAFGNSKTKRKKKSCK
jgi:hypothetical protein